MRVNVSALQLRDPAFPGRVASVLRETGLPPQALGLEVTETVWLADTGRVARNLTAVTEMGVALLLDDVGAGHSSLAYLERFPVFECFKIDKGYIDALDTRRGRAVVTAIVALAKAYEMTVVGEGVETGRNSMHSPRRDAIWRRGSCSADPSTPSAPPPCWSSVRHGRRRFARSDSRREPNSDGHASAVGNARCPLHSLYVEATHPADA